MELARLIVASDARGRGVGTAMVTALLERAAGTGLRQVCLRVRAENLAAIRCYAAVGFSQVDEARAADWNAAQPVRYTWMEYRRAQP